MSDLARLAHGDRRSRDYTVHAMRQVLTEIIERLPVYRSYISDEPSPEDRTLIEETVAAAIAGTPMPDTSLHRFVAALLLGEADRMMTAPPPAEHLARFRRRFQQLSGPVTAKSLEDTLFYRYGPLLALNEVGGEPNHHGVSAEAFHAANAERHRDWPHAMIATATHDTKRGEDGRARLLSLTEMPQRWAEASSRWHALSSELAPDRTRPDANDRQFILQQMLASWPVELLESDDAPQLDAFRERMQGWVEKALREAKRKTSWINPQEAYEQAAKDLIAGALAAGSSFLETYRPLARDLAQRGMVRGLSRTVLKLTLPGVPDVYQGTEFWDLSLVDPDNRRTVDYEPGPALWMTTLMPRPCSPPGRTGGSSSASWPRCWLTVPPRRTSMRRGATSRLSFGESARSISSASSAVSARRRFSSSRPASQVAKQPRPCRSGRIGRASFSRRRASGRMC